MSSYTVGAVSVMTSIVALAVAIPEWNRAWLRELEHGEWNAQKIHACAGALHSISSLQGSTISTAAQKVVQIATREFKAKTQVESVRRMADHVAQLECLSVAIVAEKSLRELKYSTRLVQSDGIAAIEASGRGHTKLLVVVESHGAEHGLSLQADWAGLTDKSCVQLQAEFEQKMAKNGVVVSDAQKKDHFTAGGDKLIRVAAQSDPTNLANGAVIATKSSRNRIVCGNSQKGAVKE